jgi:hypothetical protein
MRIKISRQKAEESKMESSRDDKVKYLFMGDEMVS